MLDYQAITDLADRCGFARPTVARWFEGKESPSEVVQRMIARMGWCPCIKREAPVCGDDCWHFGAHKSICRFCGHGAAVDRTGADK